MTHVRYAVYYTLPPGPFADLAAAWLGWDIAGGRPVPHPPIPGLPAPAEAITATPRRYGFHATLKPPFRLTPGTGAKDLLAAVRALAATAAPVRLDGLRLAAIGDFVALVPSGDTAALDGLAARLVAELDTFRAPAAPDELARRRAGGLTATQDANLARWGYPYVMEDFRFHMTLSGPLPPPGRDALIAALAPAFGPHIAGPVHIDAVTLAGQDDRGYFHQMHRIALSG